MGTIRTRLDPHDAKAWAKWATAAGVDPRGIAFVLDYPETVTAICTRLYLYVTIRKYRKKSQLAHNFAEFLLQECLPNDLRVA